MKNGWQPAPAFYTPLGPHAGLQFPIRKGLLPSPWIVIDECRRVDGKYDVRLHDDADHKNKFRHQEDWGLWPNKRKLSEWHNEPFRRMTRLSFVRMTSLTSQHIAILDNHSLSLDALKLQSLILADKDGEHQAGNLDWSPSGQVWLNGKRWVKIESAS